MIDLRSDTVTKPTPEMRRAMANAEVGDDVYGEDPTVNRLEERAAEIFGKEAALFVPTGTMGNTIACKLHTRHGQEVIADVRAHIFDYELAMIGWFCGCVVRPITTADGILRWADIRAAYKPLGPHAAPTGLVELENTHNIGGGTVYPQAELNEICDESHALGLKVHVDGARIFNASTHLGLPVQEMCARADTVMFCLSKGLGAPAGSMVAGRRDAMDEGRRLRKRLGGGMRQAGILAAACLIALEKMPQRLHEDHANARWLAGELAAIPGIEIKPELVQTNILMFDVSATGIDAKSLSDRLKTAGVLANEITSATMRMVTHFDVTRRDCEQAVAVLRKIVSTSQFPAKGVELLGEA